MLKEKQNISTLKVTVNYAVLPVSYCIPTQAHNACKGLTVARVAVVSFPSSLWVNEKLWRHAKARARKWQKFCALSLCMPPKRFLHLSHVWKETTATQARLPAKYRFVCIACLWCYIIIIQQLCQMFTCNKYTDKEGSSIRLLLLIRVWKRLLWNNLTMLLYILSL